MKLAKIWVTPKSAGALNTLYKEIDEKFPNIDDLAQSFEIETGKKVFAGMGDAEVKEMALIWEVTDPNSESAKTMEEVLSFIKNSGHGDVRIEYITK